MKNYYVVSNGRIRRDSNTIVIEQQSTGIKRPIPVEDVESLFVFGEVDVNSKLLNFLAQKHIALHLFNYYGHYSGTFYPREYLHSGYLAVQQASHYTDAEQRMILARETVLASAHSIKRTLAYYLRRKPQSADSMEPTGEIDSSGAPQSPMPAGVNEDDAISEQESAVDSMLHAFPATSDMSAGENHRESSLDEPLQAEASEDRVEQSSRQSSSAGLEPIVRVVDHLAEQIHEARDVNVLRGLEGKMRERYYAAWAHILIGDWSLERRVRRPPDNELNALISFGNSWLYTICVGEIYRTQLLPTIAYLHEPGERRFSLALDLSELFKPLIVDRTIFRLINNRQIEARHFDKGLESCFLSETGKQLYMRELEEKLSTTIRHRRLRRSVSYKQLIRLECYKLVRHLTGVEPYRAFRAWW